MALVRYHDAKRGAPPMSDWPERGPPRFPFTVIKALGIVHFFLGGLLFILGIVAVSLNTVATDPLLIFGAVSMTITTMLAVIIGVLAYMHSESRRNLEAYRNSLMLLCTVTSLFAGAFGIYQCVLHYSVYGQTLATLSGTASTNSGIWIVLILFTILLALVAGATGFVLCCLPAFCTPIVDNSGYVYTYDRKVRPHVEPTYRVPSREYGRARRPRYVTEPQIMRY